MPVDIRDDIQSEDEKLELLLVANFGREKNDEVKRRKVAVEYVRLKGRQQGENRFTKTCDNRISIEEIAKQLGTNKRTLQELLEIEKKLTPELKEILDSGGINKTTASKILVKLSPEEQTSLLEELGRDQLAAMKILFYIFFSNFILICLKTLDTVRFICYIKKNAHLSA